MREIKKDMLVEKATAYFYTIDMAHQRINIPAFIQAKKFVEWLDKNGRIDRYGNLKKGA